MRKNPDQLDLFKSSRPPSAPNPPGRPPRSPRRWCLYGDEPAVNGENLCAYHLNRAQKDAMRELRNDE